jgi:triacylglycerol lipase
LLARSSGGLAFQHLIYPMLDDRTCIPVNVYAGEFIWQPLATTSAYVCRASSWFGRGSPYAAAARRGSKGLPPTFSSPARSISSWTRTWSMRDDFAGVPTDPRVRGAYHGFTSRRTRGRVAARRDSVAALARALEASA